MRLMPVAVQNTPFTPPRAQRAAGWAAVARLMVLVLVGVALGLPVAAQADEDFINSPADFAVLMDYETGDILYEKNADELMAPASMSKLMTLEMLFNRLKSGAVSMDDKFLISEDAWRRGGAPSESSTMFAKVNTRIAVKDLLRGIIVQSGNDACIAVAEAIGGTELEFANMMTARARDLGMEQSIFSNSTGWPDPGQLMTARELAMLARHIIREYPQYYPIFSEKSFTWNRITQTNRNPLIHTFPGADGLKTGHTEDSGYGLVGSAERDGRRVIMVFNGLDSNRARAIEAKRLMAIAFGSFSKEELYTAGDEVGLADVHLGQGPVVPLVLKDNLETFVHARARRDIKSTLTYKSPLVAPIAEGDEVARLTVSIPGRAPLSLPVYAGADVPKLGMFGQLYVRAGEWMMGEEPTEPEPKSVKAYRRQAQ